MDRFKESVFRFAQQVVMYQIVKNNDSNRELDSIQGKDYDGMYGSNKFGCNDTTFGTKSEWIVKRYRAHIMKTNDDNTDKRFIEQMVKDRVNTEFGWILKRYRINNDITFETGLEWNVK